MPDERLRAAAKDFMLKRHKDRCSNKTCPYCHLTKPVGGDRKISELAAFAKEREDSAMREAAQWIRSNCQVDTGDGIYGDAARYTEKEIIRAIGQKRT